jgi:hypothetical protein
VVPWETDRSTFAMILIIPLTPKFELGEVFATANAIATFANDVLLHCLNRHAEGDWGDLDAEDKEANDDALATGGRILSSYIIPSTGKLWAITEHDRSATTLLLPEDY